ncbi:MAG: hypothetical protein GEU95_26875 [Rhizobiales bacterium]|nr:hypothetical protein [Hyphomicrobiales bacterium]
MALITFPRAKPDELTIVGLSFILDPVQEVTPTRGGKQIAADLGPTLWTAEMRSGQMEEDDFGIVRAWFDTLSSLEEFYGYDKLREYPVSYGAADFAAMTVGGNPFDGTCSLANVVDNGLTVQLNSLPVGFKLRPGDYLAFEYGTSDELRALHRVSAGGDADGSGELDVEVRPRVRTGWEAAATVMLYRPAARMVVMPKSYTETIIPPTFGEVSFRAIQTLGS